MIGAESFPIDGKRMAMVHGGGVEITELRAHETLRGEMDGGFGVVRWQ